MGMLCRHRELVQIVHSRSPTVVVRVREEGLFKKKEVLQISAAGEVTAGAPLSLDFGPGKLESQV